MDDIASLARAVVDDCSRRALRVALAGQANLTLGLDRPAGEDPEVDGLLEALFGADGVYAQRVAANINAPLWERFSVEVTDRVQQLGESPAGESGVSIAESNGWDDTTRLARDFVSAFLYALDEPAVSSEAVRALWQVLAQGRSEEAQRLSAAEILSRLDSTSTVGVRTLDNTEWIRLYLQNLAGTTMASPPIAGDRKIQIHTSGLSITISYGDGPKRRVPLEPAVLGVGRRVTSPAQLIRARSGVVPYVDRAGLLDDLERWALSPEAFAGCVIGGRGGTGKTRLGVELCVRAGTAGWLCGLLSHRADQAALEALVEIPTSRLVVVDCAESRIEQLESEAEAVELLRLVPDLADASAERRGRLARWAHQLYPGPKWWNALEPDLVGEHLVAACFSQHPQVLAAVLDRQDPQALFRPLDLYARAAPDHPPLAAALRPILTELLGPLSSTAVKQAATETDLDLLLGQTTVAAALDRAVTVIDVDPQSLPEVLNRFPQRPDLILGPLALTLTAKLVAHRRRLAAADPAAYEPALATSLNNLSIRLGEAGRREEADSARQEAQNLS